jgi:glyoxylase-like metal-dependent hydrolase (beta-lactamase superfamily II)
MIIEVRAVEPFYKNGFVLSCARTRESVVIDPGDEVDDLLAVVEDRQLAVKHILLTHGHVDHVAGVARAKQALRVPIHLHQLDRRIYEAAVQQGAYFGLQVDEPPPVDCWYEDGLPITFGDYEVHALHTPGHTPGGVCLEIHKTGAATSELVVGDTLFRGSIGRTDLPGGNYQALIRSIKEVLFGFPDATKVHPGHGPETTIGEERRTNPFLK